MASLLKLKTDIKKLKAAIASKATSGAIKTKLRGKLTSLENELDKLQPNKRKPKTTGPKSESALVKLAKKRRTNQGLSTSKSDIERDAIRPAKKAGKRISASGNRYYEYRDNRVDNRQPPKKYRKLADGGNTSDFDNLIADKFKMQDWYENFNDGLSELVTKKYITKAELNKIDNYSDRMAIDPYEKYGKMSGRAAAKKFVDDNKRYTKMADGGMMAKGGKVKNAEWAVTIESEDGETYDWVGFAKSEDDAVYEAEQEAGFESVSSGVNMITDEDGNEIQYKHGGKTQGYDDKKDESLGMTRGKLSLKDFVGNRKQKEHARRDDARFEERGKMDHGGYMAKGGEVKVGDILTANTGVKVKVVEYDSKFGGRVRVERIDEYATGKPSQFMPLSRFKMADGGMMAKGGNKSYAIIYFPNNKKVKKSGYQSAYKAFSDYESEGSLYAELYTNGNLSSTYPKIDKGADTMAMGGKTKDQEVVRGYFEDEAYEYGKGGEMMSDDGDVPYKAIKKMQKIRVNELNGWLPGDKYIWHDEPSKRFYFKDFEGRIMEIKNLATLKQIESFIEKNEIKLKEGGYMADGGSVDYKLEVINQYSDEKLARIYSHLNDYDYSEILAEIKGDPAERKHIVSKIFKEVVERDNQMADGGSVAKGNYEMLMSQAKEVMHHAEELMQVAKPDMDVEAWVVAKAERATTDLSDITHYLDGLKMAMGGMVKHNAHKVNG